MATSIRISSRPARTSAARSKGVAHNVAHEPSGAAARERERTKTEAGRRGIGIPEQLVTLLREHRVLQVERGVSVRDDSFVFASITGTPIDRRRAHRVVQAAARKAKLIGRDENLRVHDLRSGFALNSLPKIEGHAHFGADVGE